MTEIRDPKPMVRGFEPKRCVPYPNGIWTSDQFWANANKTANDILVQMVASGHSMPQAAKNGLIDPSYAADYLVENVIATINAQCIPAGNA